MSHVDVLTDYPPSSVADKCRHDIKSCPKVDTRKVKPYQLACLSQLVLNIELLDMAKPTSSRNEFHTVSTMVKGKLELINERFSTRVRRSFQVRVPDLSAFRLGCCVCRAVGSLGTLADHSRDRGPEWSGGSDSEGGSTSHLRKRQDNRSCAPPRPEATRKNHQDSGRWPRGVHVR